MKRIAIILLGIWMTTGLYAQTWLPEAQRLQGEHESMVIDFKLVIDGEVYAPSASESSPYRIAAFVDGIYRGESQFKYHYQADGTVALSYFTLMVYGLTDSESKENMLAGKPVTFRLYDESTGLEYILPNTHSYTFTDGAHHGSLTNLETISFSTIGGMYLREENIYCGQEYNLNDFVTFFSHGDEVTDGTRLHLTWQIGQPSVPGFELDTLTGVFTPSNEVIAGKYKYYAHPHGNILNGYYGTLNVLKNASQIVILRDSIDVLSGTDAFNFLVKGRDYDVLPSDALSDVFVSWSNGEVIGDDGLLRYGSAQAIITASSNYEAKDSLMVYVYDDVSEFSTDATTLYLPDTVSDLDAWLWQHITLAPATAKQQIAYLRSSDYNIIGINRTTGKPVINGLGEAKLTIAPALSGSNQELTLTLIVHKVVDELVIVNDSYDAVLGERLTNRVYESEATFYFSPLGNNTLPYAYSVADAGFLTPDSCFAKLGSTTMTLWHPARPDLQGQVTLHVYDEATNIDYIGDVVYIPRTATDLMVYLHKHVSLVPATAKQEFKITSSSNAAVIGRATSATGAPYIIRGCGSATLFLKPTVTSANRSYVLPVVVFEPVAGIEILQPEIEGIVRGTGKNNIYDLIQYGTTFRFLPQDNPNIVTDYTVTLDDPSMIDADGNFIQYGTTQVTIASVTNPEVSGQIKLVVYSRALGISVTTHDDGYVYVPDTVADVDAWLRRFVEVRPATAKQELEYYSASGALKLQSNPKLPAINGTIATTGSVSMFPAGFPAFKEAFPVRVYTPVTEITLHRDTLITYVNTPLSDHFVYGTDYTFTPSGARVVRTLNYTLDNPELMDESGVFIQGGTTQLTLSPYTDPEVKATIPLVVYDYSEAIAYDEPIYIPIDAHNPKQLILDAITVLPATANQEIEFLWSSHPEVLEIMGGRYFHLYGLGETTVSVRTADGFTTAELRVIVYRPVESVTTLISEVDIPVGANLYDFLKADIHYQVNPADAPQEILFITDDTTIVAPDGTLLRDGTTRITLASVLMPEIQSETPIVVNAFNKLLGFTLSVDGQLYDSPHHFSTHRYEKIVITLAPQPENATIDPEHLDVGIWDDWNFASGITSLKVESCIPNYRPDGTLKDFTIVVKPQAFGSGDLMIEYSDQRQGLVDKSYFFGFTVYRDMPLENGWNWTALFEQVDARYEEVDGELNFDAPTYDHYNDADRFGGGLIDLRLPGNYYLHKDPVYGLFGHIEETWANGAKINFDRGQATGVSFVKDSTVLIYNSGYMTTYRGGAADRTPIIYQGWNWIGYPYLYDYSIDLLGIRTNDITDPDVLAHGLPYDGDLILAHDGSMLVYDATTHEWLTPDGGDYTFRYGQMYLYHTDQPDNPTHVRRFYWGDEARNYPMYDLTDEAAYAPATRRASSAWDYDIHRFADRMAIIACLDGISTPSDYSIGAFVGDECRGEGHAVNDWMFITLSGESKDQVTFRLLNKRTGASYPLGETLRFSPLKGSLRAPFRFDAREIASGIESVSSEGTALLVTSDVATAPGLISVYDMQGKLVAEGYGEVSLTSLARGIYMIRAGDEVKQILR